VLDIFFHLVKKEARSIFTLSRKQHQIEGLIEKYENAGLEVEFYRSCGLIVAPGVCRWVFDSGKRLGCGKRLKNRRRIGRK